MFLFLVLVFNLLNVNAFTHYNSQGPVLSRRKRVIGGSDSEITEHPNMVSIFHEDQHRCGGTIISKHYVLTASHCVMNLTIDNMEIHAGSSDNYVNCSIHSVTEAIPHPLFYINDRNNTNNDIAVLRVKEPFIYDETRQPGKLYHRVLSKNFQPSDKAVVAGWGFHKYYGNYNGSWTYLLQTLEMPLVSKSTCNAMYKDFGGIYKGQLCAGYVGVRNKDVCYGDSGGPLMWHGKVIGIAAYIESKCGELDYPSVFTEVAYYLPWIKKHVEFD